MTQTASPGPRTDEPEAALAALAGQLREGATLVSACVRDCGDVPALGLLAAAGPRASHAPGPYARVVESVREGYLLHYAEPRILVVDDRDLALLAGDYMYASGLALLASLGDLDAIRVLADLISLCAEAHTGAAADTSGLWLAGAVAIAVGDANGHHELKREHGTGAGSGTALWSWARSAADRAGIAEQLDAAAETVGFRANERR